MLLNHSLSISFWEEPQHPMAAQEQPPRKGGPRAHPPQRSLARAYGRAFTWLGGAPPAIPPVAMPGPRVPAPVHERRERTQ